MVAKSYQGLPHSPPFKENGKEYVTITTKTGLTKKVRWYPEPKDITVVKKALGFPITTFQGDEEELASSNARFCEPFGWYLPEGIGLNSELAGFVTKVITWEAAEPIVKKYLEEK